ncbi:uncharacterized protein KY384_001230 [Bacidia gigantensis]|uniref:uncharacterized protein n=1 Tax=Bacidia gigantensis TaxID=2732470 RepID=UPI001D055CCC|nr:uncharacterized protein KY384_001230 [Bacidia gigantensis]KAG8534385.1 hypothetical protein KY384_001230 [Bacidia gigantensis]
MPFRDLLRARSSSATPIDPHEWKLPHRFPVAQSIDEQPQIPDPAIFKDLRLQPNDSASTTSSIPFACDLAVHLCLLECLHKFRRDAIQSKTLDIMFQGLTTPERTSAIGDEKGIAAQKSTAKEEVDTEDEGYQKRKWSLIVKLAVARFELWWQNIEGIMSQAAAYAPIHQRASFTTLFTKDYLPPLDVLMVWHSYVLDTANFKSDCSKFDKQKFFTLGLPWKAIHDTISREDFSYNLTKPAQKIFRTKLSQSPDFLKDITTPPLYSAGSADKPLTNLIKAIHAQEQMMERAHMLLWIRSPALQSSLSRTLSAYQRALPNLAKEDQLSEIPSLSFDIALSWYTHQLSPPSYHHYVEKSTCANAEYKCPATSTAKSEEGERLAPPPDYTAKDEHHTCLCWTCEAIKDATKNKIPNVRALTQEKQSWVQEDVGFHVAAESARRSGRKLPMRKKGGKEKKEDVWEEDYGIYYYTTIMPAEYDKKGNLVKKEERVVMREMGYGNAILWTMGSVAPKGESLVWP